MIQAAGSVSDGSGQQRPVMLVGLLPVNLARLAAGDPIVFEAAEMGLAPMRVVILARETSAEIREYLAPIINADTAEHAGSLAAVHRVDWRAVATELADAVTGTFRAGRAWPPPVNAALARFRAARDREGL